jgi:uncharacterized membrane protein YidH (DUF202 family)
MGLDGVFAALAVLLLALAVVGFPAYYWILDRRRRGEGLSAVIVMIAVVTLVVTLSAAAWFLWPWARAHDLV